MAIHALPLRPEFLRFQGIFKSAAGILQMHAGLGGYITSQSSRRPAYTENGNYKGVMDSFVDANSR